MLFCFHPSYGFGCIYTWNIASIQFGTCRSRDRNRKTANSRVSWPESIIRRLNSESGDMSPSAEKFSFYFQLFYFVSFKICFKGPRFLIRNQRANPITSARNYLTYRPARDLNYITGTLRRQQPKCKFLFSCRTSVLDLVFTQMWGSLNIQKRNPNTLFFLFWGGSLPHSGGNSSRNKRKLYKGESRVLFNCSLYPI